MVRVRRQAWPGQGLRERAPAGQWRRPASARGRPAPGQRAVAHVGPRARL